MPKPKVKPFTPAEAEEAKEKSIPPEVIDEFNKAIAAIFKEGEVAMPIKPISPSEVNKPIPDEVIDEFNKAISANWKGDSAVVRQKEILFSIAKRLKIKQDDILDNQWLDIEKIFTQAGWVVRYESPDWGESYDEFFEFTKKRRSR